MPPDNGCEDDVVNADQQVTPKDAPTLLHNVNVFDGVADRPQSGAAVLIDGEGSVTSGRPTRCGPAPVDRFARWTWAEPGSCRAC